MIKDNQETIDKIEQFNDSFELALQLRNIAYDAIGVISSSDIYYLNECAEHIEGQFNLIMDLKNIIIALTKDK